MNEPKLITTKVDIPEVSADDLLESAVIDATEAFWADIVESYPESTSGDLDPNIIWDMHQIMKAGVKRWIELNVPKDDNALTELGELL